MFKRIHSDLGKSAAAEALQALLPAVIKLRSFSISMISCYPKIMFSLMLLALLASGYFSFLSRKVSPQSSSFSKKEGAGKAMESFNEGLEKISGATAGIREHLAISRAVDSLLGKSSLSPSDSIFLKQAIIKLKTEKP